LKIDYERQTIGEVGWWE